MLKKKSDKRTDRKTDAEQKVIGKAQLTFQSGELRKKVPDLYHLLKYTSITFLFYSEWLKITSQHAPVCVLIHASYLANEKSCLICVERTQTSKHGGSGEG